MKKVTLLFLTITISFSFVQSQPVKNRTFDEFYSRKIIESNFSGNSLDLSSIQGSPFLNNDFQSGSIVTTSNTSFDDVPIRYNIFNDEMEFRGNDNNSYYFEKSTIKSLQIGNIEFIYKAYSNKNSIGRSYFEVLTKGAVTLLKRYHVRFEEGQPAKAFADPTPAKFNTLEPDYYIEIGEQEAIRFSNLKNLLEILPSKKSEIEKFTKSNKLKTGNQADLIKIIEFYNSEV